MAQRFVLEPCVAEVKCYFCGHVSGSIVSLERGPTRPVVLLLPSGEARLTSGRGLRCRRCSGSVYLEERPGDGLPEATLRRVYALLEEEGPRAA